ncbi:MAG TPA: Gfo/Idh/MocA family oxidoreductase [Candidatus Acidoferrum sp.]|nr:Gfo/Idh/MocA family oxidoreductase [Candidatus Acidoferrum sp.]
MTPTVRRDMHPRMRISIVGCGSFARLYHVPALLADPRVSLVAICDPSPAEEVRGIADRAGARLTSNLDDLWQNTLCDAVLISSPHTLHAEHVRSALAAEKHVMVDKPFVMHTREAEELTKTASARGLVAAVAFNRRLDPGCLRAQAILASGDLGVVRHVETIQLGYPLYGWYQDPKIGGGGPFVGRGAHMADLIPWLLDERPGRARCRILPGPAGRVERGGYIEIEFGGCVCHMTILDRGLYNWDEVRIFGDNGVIELRRPISQPLGWEMTRLDSQGHQVETVPADEARGQATRNFLDALDGRTAPACTFSDAWLSVRLIEAAYESCQANGHWIDV